ncbi:uncharacterized protein [Amphiura filiformis]|uniref:uncharacterized protein n=1 Tax=Amphiura filiformis TaxID=82378 RepID=UPI003B20E8B7
MASSKTTGHWGSYVPRDTLKYIWYLLQKRDSSIPPLQSVLDVVDTLPGFKPPVDCHTPDGIPFTTLSVTHQLRQFMSTPSKAQRLTRYPRKNTDNIIREIFDADHWATNAQYHTPMVSVEGEHYYVKDFIYVQAQHGEIKLGRIIRFYLKVHEKTSTLMCEIRVCKLHGNKVCFMGALKAAVPVDKILHHFDGEISESTVGWIVNGNDSPQQMTLEVCKQLAEPNPIKEHAHGRQVVTIPIMLFSDDFGGNLTKKWNKMGVWTCQVAGISKDDTAEILFLAASNQVSALSLASPIINELKQLETTGAIMYDASKEEEVLVLAPLLCILADNDRHAEIVNHIGASASLYCRLCDIHRSNGHKEGNPRTRETTERQMQDVRQITNERLKREARTASGVTDKENPLFELQTFKANEAAPLERLHSLLLGPCKSITKVVMDELTNAEKATIKAKLKSFDWSAFGGESLGDVTTKSNTFFGRDFRLWLQVAPFVLLEHLDDNQRHLWTSHTVDVLYDKYKFNTPLVSDGRVVVSDRRVVFH